MRRRRVPRTRHWGDRKETIQVTEGTKRDLREWAGDGETFDSAISRLMDRELELERQIELLREVA